VPLKKRQKPIGLVHCVQTVVLCMGVVYQGLGGAKPPMSPGGVAIKI